MSRRVMVTAGASGIGRAIAARFRADGAWVSVIDADPVAVEAARESDPGLDAVVGDVTDAAVVAMWADDVIGRWGGIDVLVNNAGIPKRRRVQDLTVDVVEQVMAINYFSPIRLTLALLPGIIERQGHIVNISSIAARLGPPGEAAYSASKAAITAWSECMAVDLRDTGVGVHVVNPAVIDTELFHLPDNDAAMTEGVEALPTEAMVEPVLRALDEGSFEVYVPEHFAGVTQHKFADPDGFLATTIEYVRSTQG